MNKYLTQEIKRIESADNEGWDTEKEVSLFMNNLIKMSEFKDILEIGTYRGVTTLYLAEGLKNGGSVVTIDIKDYASETFKYSHFKKKINPQIGQSKQILKSLKKKYDFVFIDGDHSELGAYNDFATVNKYVKRGGIVAFHDSNTFKGVRNVVNYINNRNDFQVINFRTPRRELKNNKTHTGLTFVMKTKKHAIPRVCDFLYVCAYRMKIVLLRTAIKTLKNMGFKEQQFKFLKRS